MKIHNLAQGTPEWHAYRALHFNASDAPAMLGCSPYKTRSQLVQEYATGATQEVDAATQRRFDDGHRFEALARPIAEKIIGEELYPVVGSEGKYSASFDGLTMAEDTGFEHKSLNDELRSVMVDGCTGADLPKLYRAQNEQQCMVSGCKRILFMASKWQGDDLVEERHCWYEPDLSLRAEIIAGWEQFALDVANYTPPAVTAVVVAEPVQALPAVSVQVTGEIAVRDNFAAFEVAVRDFLEHRLIREPKTDQDFADLDVQIKAMKGAEAALDSAEEQMLAQIQTVDAAKKTKDMLAKLVRDNRLMAEKLLESEKQRRRGEIVSTGTSGLREHIDALNKRLGKILMPAIPADFAGVIKGKKSLASMEDAVAVELARAKIAANEVADRIQVNLATLNEIAADHQFLFADVAQLVLKPSEDFTAAVKLRIAEHQAAEEKKEQARQQAEAAVKAAAQRPEPATTITSAYAGRPAPAPAAQNVVAIAPTTAPALRLGQICERLGFTVTAEFLTSLGFPPAATDKSAKLYHESDFTRICAALVNHIHQVQERLAA